MVRTCYSDLYVSYTLKRTVRVHNTVYLREAHIILGYTLNHMVRVHNTVFLRKPYIILSYTLKLYRSFTVKYSKELLFRIGDQTSVVLYTVSIDTYWLNTSYE